MKDGECQTPEERSALMAEHMQTMRDGMEWCRRWASPAAWQHGQHGASKGWPAACDMHESHCMMACVMEMMESMMQIDDGSHALAMAPAASVNGQHATTTPSSDTEEPWRPERGGFGIPVIPSGPGDRGCCWLLMDRASRPPVAMVALRDFVALSVDARFHASRAWQRCEYRDIEG